MFLGQPRFSNFGKNSQRRSNEEEWDSWLDIYYVYDILTTLLQHL